MDRLSASFPAEGVALACAPWLGAGLFPCLSFHQKNSKIVLKVPQDTCFALFFKCSL